MFGFQYWGFVFWFQCVSTGLLFSAAHSVGVYGSLVLKKTHASIRVLVLKLHIRVSTHITFVLLTFNFIVLSYLNVAVSKMLQKETTSVVF